MIQKILSILLVVLIIAMAGCNNSVDSDFEELDSMKEDSIEINIEDNSDKDIKANSQEKNDLENSNEAVDDNSPDVKVSNENDENADSSYLEDEKDTVDNKKSSSNSEITTSSSEREDFDIDYNALKLMDDEDLMLYVMTKTEINKDSFSDKNPTKEVAAAKFCYDYFQSFFTLQCDEILDGMDEIVYEGYDPRPKVSIELEMEPFCSSEEIPFELDMDQYIKTLDVSVINQEVFNALSEIEDSGIPFEFTQDHYYCLMSNKAPEYEDTELNMYYYIVEEKSDGFKVIAFPR